MDDYLGSIAPDKLRLDQLYVRHHTFITDLDALFWTFVVLIPRLGDKRISEGWLFGGPVTRLLRRYLNWMAVDFITAFLSIGLVGFVWRLRRPFDLGLGRSVIGALILAALFTAFNILLDLRSISWTRAAPEEAFRLILSCGLVTLTIALVQDLLLPQPGLTNSFILSVGAVVLFGFVATRYRLRLITGLASRWIGLRHSGYGAGERVLVIGAGQGSEFAAWLLSRPEFNRLYQAVGIVDDDPAKQGMRFDGLRVLGTTADIPELVERYDVGVLYYAIVKIARQDQRRILATCRKTRLRLIMLSELLRALHGHLTSSLPCSEEGCPLFAPPERYAPLKKVAP